MNTEESVESKQRFRGENKEQRQEIVWSDGTKKNRILISLPQFE